MTGNEVDDWDFILSSNGNFSFHHHIQTKSGAHLVSHPVGANSSWKYGGWNMRLTATV
jgi:hypothetical protein